MISDDLDWKHFGPDGQYIGISTKKICGDEFRFDRMD